MRPLAVIATLALLLTTACGGNSTSAEVLGTSTDSGITLRVAMYTAMGFEELIDEWEHEHPGVTVEILDAPWNEQNEQMIAGYPIGETPDIVTVETDYMARLFADPSRFVDLRTYGVEDLRPSFLDWRWDQAVTSSGEVLGVPTDVGGLAMAYRVDLFDAAGLPTDPGEVSQLFDTWEGYLQVGQTYTRTTGRPFLDSAAWLFNAMSNQAQGRFSYSIAADGAYQPSESTRRIWEFAAQMAPMSAGIDTFSPEALSTTDPAQQFATVVAPAWMTNFIMDSAPRTERLWDIARIPGNGGNWGGSQLTIPAEAEHKALAWDLISYLSTPAAQLLVFELHGNLPSIPALYEHPVVATGTNAFFNDAPVGQVFTDALEPVTSAVVTRHDRVITEAFNAALDRVTLGQVDAETGWQQAIDEIQAVMDAPGQ